MTTRKEDELIVALLDDMEKDLKREVQDILVWIQSNGPVITVRDKLDGQPIHIPNDGDYELPEDAVVFQARRRYIKAEPDVVRAVIRAIRAGQDPF